jgi:hypothetical protein
LVVADRVLADLKNYRLPGGFGTPGDRLGMLQGDDVERAYPATCLDGLIDQEAGFDKWHGFPSVVIADSGCTPAGRLA